jgi:hypothetical protein
MMAFNGGGGDINMRRSGEASAGADVQAIDASSAAILGCGRAISKLRFAAEESV